MVIIYIRKPPSTDAGEGFNFLYVFVYNRPNSALNRFTAGPMPPIHQTPPTRASPTAIVTNFLGFSFIQLNILTSSIVNGCAALNFIVCDTVIFVHFQASSEGESQRLVAVSVFYDNGAATLTLY